MNESSVIKLVFKNTRGAVGNASMQVGDTAYYCDVAPYGSSQSSYDGAVYSNSSINVQFEDIVKIGIIMDIQKSDKNELLVTVKVGKNIIVPKERHSYIFFSKTNLVNMSSPLGYFARAKFVNNSLEKGEMFAAACEVSESSK